MIKRHTLVLLLLLVVGVTQQGFFWKSDEAKSSQRAPERKIAIGHSEYTQTSVLEPGTSQIAPDFTLKNQHGKTVALSQFKGKIVVLEWTNHECPYVKKHYSVQNMQKLQSKYAQKGVVWLSIISSAPGKQGHVTGEDADALSKERSANPTHILLDETGDVGRLYNAKTTPHMFVINESGNIVYQGAIDSNSSSNPDTIASADNYVVQALDSLLSGQSVAVSKTKPYGCSVKY